MCLVCHLHPALWLHGRLMGGVVWHRLGVSLGMSLGVAAAHSPSGDEMFTSNLLPYAAHQGPTN